MISMICLILASSDISLAVFSAVPHILDSRIRRNASIPPGSASRGFPACDSLQQPVVAFRYFHLVPDL